MAGENPKSRALLWGTAIGLLALLGIAGRGIYVGLLRGHPTEPADAGPPTDLLAAAGSIDAGPASLASVRGTVIDPAGLPAEGAVVWAADLLGHLRQARTPADGSFVLADLSPGEYRLAAQRGAQTSETEGPLPLSAGDDLRGLTLKLTNGARLAGAVFDLRSRVPLPGALIQVVATPLSATADAQGRFVLPPLPPGGHELSVEAEGHLSRVVPLAVTSGENTRDFEIFLMPSARLTGMVVNGEGNGVPRAQLLLSRYQASQDAPPPSPAGATDATGHFALDVGPGLVQLVARAPGWAEGITEMLDLEEGKPREVRLVLGAGAQVDGLVTLADGQPPSGGTAAAFRPSHWEVARARVAPDGHFTLTDLPTGRLTISADAAQARATAEVQLEAGGETSVTLRLGDGTLGGSVLDGSGRPIAGALVVAQPVGAGEAGERSALSAADGTFKVSGLSGDRFDVAATKDEGSTAIRGVAAGRRDLQLTLASGGVSGTVFGPGGSTVSDFYVAADPELPGRGRARATQVVDGHGDFHLSLSPGRYRIRGSAPGYAEAAVDDIEVAAAAETRGVRVELRPAGTIEGVVLEDPGGAPLPGVHVATDRSHAWGVGRDSPLGGSTALSGPDGHFVLRDVAPGSWPVFASAPQLRMIGPPPAVQVVAGNNPAPVELRMRKSDGNGDQPYAGIGMSLYPNGDLKFAGEVFEGGPASDAAVRPGDQILAVDGVATSRLSIQDLAGRIRGPQGSEVTLQMRRGAEGEPYTVVVPRAEIRF